MSLNPGQANTQNSPDRGTKNKTIFMRKEDWEKWDAALRSGEYKQGRLKLQTSDGLYCCLGVLQHCLTGEVEHGKVVGPLGVPSLEWLNSHGIKFMDNTGLDEVSDPWLSALGLRATNANDMGIGFVKIAKAIKESVQFTDSATGA